MTIDRRNLGKATSVLAALLLAEGGAVLSPAMAGDPAAPAPSGAAGSVASSHDMHAMPAHWIGKEEIAFLIYPGFTALDMVGPHHMLSALMGARVRLVAKSRAPVTSDTGLTFTPDLTFTQCPEVLDILCLPGGTAGTLAAMADRETLAFIKSRGERAKFVTSVCTGSLLLAAAGLLEGYRATSHWVTRPLLVHGGAIPGEGRVVRDRNRITGAGVTAGIDFGLALVASLRDQPYAEAVQLTAEYAPEPPFQSGSPATASAETRALLQGMFAGFVRDAEAAILAARKGGDAP